MASQKYADHPRCRSRKPKPAIGAAVREAARPRPTRYRQLARGMLRGPHSPSCTQGEFKWTSEILRALQAPLKEKYREEPAAAILTLKAEGRLGKGVTCSVETGRALVTAGLHPATGGDGMSACSGDMLLQALVACAGVTMGAVATALGLNLRDAQVKAEGDLDFRGTLGVAKDAPVGFREIRLSFDLDGDLSEEQRATLVKLTERYCVVYQTLLRSPTIRVASRVA